MARRVNARFVSMKSFMNLEALLAVGAIFFIMIFAVPYCSSKKAADGSTNSENPTSPPMAAADSVRNRSRIKANTTTPAPLPAPVANASQPIAAPTAAEQAATSLPAPAGATATMPQRGVRPNIENYKGIGKPAPVATTPATETVVGNDGKPVTAAASAGSVMYTQLEEVVLRGKPNTEAKQLGKIKGINTPVTYLNVRSEATQKITINGITTDEPWLKVRTARGTVGWVYGGLVRSYKK